MCDRGRLLSLRESPCRCFHVFINSTCKNILVSENASNVPISKEMYIAAGGAGNLFVDGGFRCVDLVWNVRQSNRLSGTCSGGFCFLRL